MEKLYMGPVMVLDYFILIFMDSFRVFFLHLPYHSNTISLDFRGAAALGTNI